MTHTPHLCGDHMFHIISSRVSLLRSPLIKSFSNSPSSSAHLSITCKQAATCFLLVLAVPASQFQCLNRPEISFLNSTGRTSSSCWSRCSGRCVCHTRGYVIHSSSSYHSGKRTRRCSHHIPDRCCKPFAVCGSVKPTVIHSHRCAGVSALGIDGQTLHSFAGCGVPQRADDFGKMFAKKNRPKWDKLEVLIIDEISMVQVCVASCSHSTALCMFALYQSLKLSSSAQAELLDWLDMTVRFDDG